MQNKSPAFQFYPKQWVGDNNIMMMDWDVQGMHVHLMSVAWQEDEPATLPKNEKILRKLLKNIPKKDWENRIKPQLFLSWKVWEEDETRIINNGLRREYIKQKAKSDKARKGSYARWGKDANASPKHMLHDALLLEDEVEEEVKEVKDFKTKNEPMQNSADAGIPGLDAKPVSKSASPVPKPEVQDAVEEFLIFAQKTHEQERKALLMIRGIVDRDKIKSLFDKGIDHKTLSFAWMEFLTDEGDYFQQSDAPPHNIAVFHGQVETGHYLEAAARRISSRKAHARPQPPPKALTNLKEPVDPKLTGLWDQCLGKIKAQIAPESFASWFEPTYARRLESGLLTVAVPNQFYRKCLIENYRDLIEKTLNGIRDGPLLVDFCIEADRVQLDTI